jgi:hypothetical protein
MVAHRLAVDDLLGILMLEGKRVFGFWSFKLDSADIWKSLCHNDVPMS